ncbi:MAG: helix-turn-helix domain-containing protein [candidate division Zixibacteria bacterium]|nr:helix-turn-helix domain-containing protein [candidate division Zixibacteria bacterium]
MPDTYKEIGALLAAARQEKQKTLEEAADYTKIAAKYLAAVEAGDPSPLPSKPYFLLFARSYAQFLGVNLADLEAIERNGRDAEPEPEPVPESPQTEPSHREQRLLITIVALFVLAVVVVLVIRWHFRARTVPAEDHAAPLGTVATASPDSAVVDSPLVIPYAPYRAPGKLALGLWARQPVGVVVLRDGDTVLNRRLNAGEQQRWEAEYRFALSVDAPAALSLAINDQAALPFTGRDSAIIGLEINQANYRQFLPPDTALLARRAADSIARAAADSADSTPEGARHGY